MNQPQETQPQSQDLAVYKVYHPDFKQLNLFAGQYPGSPNKKECSEKLNELLRLGISASVCLMQQHEIDFLTPYKEALIAKNPALKWLHYPIVDMSVPSKPLMVEILDKMDELIAAGEKVYVHCFGGHGRTGVVIGCWLKRHGFRKQEVYLKLAQWRNQTLFGKTSSPQSAEQFSMVNDWQKGE